MPRFSLFGKLVIGGFTALVVLVVTLLMLPDKPPPPDITAKPAQVRYNLPFKTAEEQRSFSEQAAQRPLKDFCDLYDNYSGNLGVPHTLTAVLAQGDQGAQSPTIYNKRLGPWDYRAAYLVTEQQDLPVVQALAQGDASSLNVKCVRAEAQFDTKIVMLAFPAGSPPPAGGVVSVDAVLYWDYANLNPDFFRTPIAVEGDEPLRNVLTLRVGASRPIDVRQLSYPAYSTREVGVAFRRGDGIISVNRVEYAAEETRVYLELTSMRETVSISEWEGTSSALLKSGTEQPLAVGGGAQDTDLSSLGITDEGSSLGGEESVSKVGDTRSVRLLFGKVTPGRSVRLDLPPLGSADAPVRIQLPVPTQGGG